MNLQEEETKQNKLLEILENSTDEKAISMLIELKKYGDLFYMDTILRLVTSKRSELLNKALIEFISDIKAQAAAEIISTYIANNYVRKDLSKLITASWQSRLDFSQHLAPYFHILINDNYKNAFEAFTVIENNIDGLSTEELTGFINMIKKGIANSDRDKQLLLLEMVSVLDKTRRATQ